MPCFLNVFSISWPFEYCDGQAGAKSCCGGRLGENAGIHQATLATLKVRPPSGDQWLHEIKFDGYRVQVHLDKGKKRVFTRNGLDWTKRFSVIAGALDVPGQAILDGEVVVIHEGRTNFSELQAELARSASRTKKRPISFGVSDCHDQNIFIVQFAPARGRSEGPNRDRF